MVVVVVVATGLGSSVVGEVVRTPGDGNETDNEEEGEHLGIDDMTAVLVDTCALEQKKEDQRPGENMTVLEIVTVAVVEDLLIVSVNMIVDRDLVDWMRDFDFHLCLGFDSSYRCGCDCDCDCDGHFVSSSARRTLETTHSRFLRGEYPQ